MDEGGGDETLRLEGFGDYEDGGFGVVGVALVFGVAEEAYHAGFGFFDFTWFGYGYVGVTDDDAVEELTELVGGYLQNS